jgi:hypothetical protein
MAETLQDKIDEVMLSNLREMAAREEYDFLFVLPEDLNRMNGRPYKEVPARPDKPLITHITLTEEEAIRFGLLEPTNG